MEELNSRAGQHRISLVNREVCAINGVSDVLSFAFWCRKGNIQKLKEQWGGEGEHRLGKGVVFHIAPSNVPVNFAFSYLFSLFAGNANIVRVPSKPFAQILLIANAIKEELNNFPEIKT